MASHVIDAKSQLSPGSLSPHRHLNGYASIVRRGTYIESGLSGRYRVQSAMIVLHPPLQMHSNVILESSQIWNVTYRPETEACASVFTGSGAERLIARGSKPHCDEVSEALQQCEPVIAEPMPNWMKDTVDHGFDRFDRIQHGRSREHAHREFKAYFGIAPGRWRREGKLQHTLTLMKTNLTLVEIAVEAGYSDQSHMNRIVRQETGLRPRDLRTFVRANQRHIGTRH